MKILHPYTGIRPEDELETWMFCTELGREGFTVIDQEMGVEHGYPRSAYADFIRSYWRTDDLVILEDDKVPTMEDFYELLACDRPVCFFPYPIHGLEQFSMEVWYEIQPNTLGFIKFSKAAQEALPVSEWGPDIDIPKVYPFAPVDKMIEEPLRAKLGPFHMHERPIKHNHRRTE